MRLRVCIIPHLLILYGNLDIYQCAAACINDDRTHMNYVIITFKLYSCCLKQRVDILQNFNFKLIMYVFGL